jgi:hypothetical protein
VEVAKDGVSGYAELNNEFGSSGNSGVQGALALRKHLTRDQVSNPQLRFHVQVSLTLVIESTRRYVASSCRLWGRTYMLQRSNLGRHLSRHGLHLIRPWEALCTGPDRSSIPDHFSLFSGISPTQSVLPIIDYFLVPRLEPE